MSSSETNTNEKQLNETNFDETITKDNDTTPKSSLPKDDKALKRLKRKVKEYFKEEEKTFKPFFKISLVSDNNEEENTRPSPNEKSLDTIKIMRQQETVSKLDAILSTTLAAKKIGLPVDTSKDDELLNTAQSDTSQTKKKNINQKIEKPLKLKGHIKEENLSKSLEGIKVVTHTLTQSALEDMPASKLEDLNDTQNEEELAKIILEKTGRKVKPSSKKSDKSLKQFKKEQSNN